MKFAVSLIAIAYANHDASVDDCTGGVCDESNTCDGNGPPEECVPKFKYPTPLANSPIFAASDGEVEFFIEAVRPYMVNYENPFYDYGPTNQLYAITQFEYKTPAGSCWDMQQCSNGLTCERFSGTGSRCTQTLTPDDMANVNYNEEFCFRVAAMVCGYDDPNMHCKNNWSEWNCHNIKSVITITNIQEMAVAVLDGTGQNGFNAEHAFNYGCAGQGRFDAFGETFGRSVDDVDHAFFKWKTCVQCMADSDDEILLYDYDQTTDSCANTSANLARAKCECDRALVKDSLYDGVTGGHMHDTSTCVSGGNGDHNEHGCCKKQNFYYERFSTETHCCDSVEGVKEIGNC